MTLTDQLGMLEAERDRIKAENETLKIRLAKQAGALEESRAQVRQCLARIEKLKEYSATMREHFHAFHGTADRIAKQHLALAAADRASDPMPTVAEVVNAPEAVDTIKSRVKRLIAGEAPANGAAA